MSKEDLVKKAVELAKKQGVRFGEGGLTFRPRSSEEKSRFHLRIYINTRSDSEGYASIDQHFSFLEDWDEKQLANYFIDVFNVLNIEHKAQNIK